MSDLLFWITPEMTIRGIKTLGMSTPLFSVYDFIEVVGQALARNIQLWQIYGRGHHTPHWPSCSCGNPDNCMEYKESDQKMFSDIRQRYEKKYGFSHTMSFQEMQQQRGNWSINIWTSLLNNKELNINYQLKTASMWCWPRPKNNRMSSIPVMTVSELQSLLVAMDGEVTRSVCLVDEVLGDTNELAMIGHFNVMDAEVRKTVEASLTRFMNGDHSMVQEVERYRTPTDLSDRYEDLMAARSGKVSGLLCRYDTKIKKKKEKNQANDSIFSI
jgi:hypothetical protein